MFNFLLSFHYYYFSKYFPKRVNCYFLLLFKKDFLKTRKENYIQFVCAMKNTNLQSLEKPWSIVGWITVIVFLCVCLGLLSSSYSLC